ncbi:MAG: nucleotide sugar dehydrogenase [Candidatus Omnitrophica bacterium]|nr:nucleotide sugar dehydrogenase [Candidatus Omnitrophota bacterium]
MPKQFPAHLRRKIEQRTARVGVIGLGYVGLPLAVEFARAGFPTVGIDVDEERVRTLSSGRSYIPDVPGEEVNQLIRTGALKATARYSALRKLEAVMICVPTPLRKTREPDISFIVAAAEALLRHLHPHQVIVLESTTYPGTTEELILPKLESTGLKVGRDFFLGFSPERIDPGNPDYKTSNIPKVVSGVTPACRQAIELLYRQIIGKVTPVSSPRVAEMVKLLENTFRSVNIGLVNELALMCHRLGVDVWEVIEAAKTKPFGFMPFYPGPGIGGHCIPLDPLYLSWKAKMHGFEPRFIELSSQVNAAMPGYVVERVAQALNAQGKALKGSKVLVLGVAYKRNVGDTRESPALEIIQHLRSAGCEVAYHDPFVPRLSFDSFSMRSVPLIAASVSRADCVAVITDHDSVDYRFLLQRARLVVDTRNALRRLRAGYKKKIVRL